MVNPMFKTPFKTPPRVLPPQALPSGQPTARRGVTFIELIGVLVVAIIIIAGALALYSEANTSSRTNQLLVAVGALTGTTRALHANLGGWYGGEANIQPNGAVTITTMKNIVPTLVNANAVPPGLQITKPGTGGSSGGGGGGGGSGGTSSATATIKHAFGGEVRVDGFGQHFAVGALNLDTDICIRLATESSAKTSSGLRGMYVGNRKADKYQQAVQVVTKRAQKGAQKGVLNRGEGRFLGSADENVLPIPPNSANTACSHKNANNSDPVTNNMIIWVFQ